MVRGLRVGTTLIDDRELQQLVDRLVAAGAPGAAGLAWDETGNRQAAGRGG